MVFVLGAVKGLTGARVVSGMVLPRAVVIGRTRVVGHVKVFIYAIIFQRQRAVLRITVG